MKREELRDMEFEVKWPPEPTEGDVIERLKAAEAGLLTSRDYIKTLQERVTMLAKVGEQSAATIRKLERRVKQLEAQLDDSAPIDITPWEKLMQQRCVVDDTRESTGLLEDE